MILFNHKELVFPKRLAWLFGENFSLDYCLIILFGGPSILTECVVILNLMSVKKSNICVKCETKISAVNLREAFKNYLADFAR